MLDVQKPVWRERQRFAITNEGGTTFTIATKGRASWFLHILRLTGAKGVTTAELPAGVRVSSALHILRQKGVVISTDMERHDGDFAGNHGRFTLKSKVIPLFDTEGQS